MSEERPPKKRSVPDFSAPARRTGPKRDYQQKGIEVELDPLTKRTLDRTARRIEDQGDADESS